MQSTGAKAALAIGAIAVIVVLFVLLQGGDNSNDDTATTGVTTPTATTTTTTPKPSKPKPPVLVIGTDGSPVGGVKRLKFNEGDRVRFAVRSKADDSVHIHGYDIEKDVPAGKTVTFSFPATLEGIFEVESHVSEQQIAELRVNP